MDATHPPRLGIRGWRYKMSKLTENFEGIAAALEAAAPTEKGRTFAAKIAAQIRANGAEWIEANHVSLHIDMSVKECEELAPVADNRLFFMQEWQLALADLRSHA
jgi:hypothetical protein